MAGFRGSSTTAALSALLLAACAESAPAPVPSPLTGHARPAAATRRPPAKRPSPARPSPAKPSAKLPDSVHLEQTLIQQRAHAPLARVLARRSGNAAVADRVAAAVVREARRRRVSPSLVAGVLLVENAGMDTTARSRAGAIGLMQVMPFHAGGWGCDSAELSELDANVCHGVGVLQMYLRRNANVTTALRRYNGCSGCRRYPARVLRTASSIRREMLAQQTPPKAKPKAQLAPSQPQPRTAPKGGATRPPATKPQPVRLAQAT